MKQENLKPTAPPLDSGSSFDSCTVNKCVSELSARLSETQIHLASGDAGHSDNDATNPSLDPSSFVTVIEVNGLKSLDTHPPPLKLPPKYVINLFV